MVSTNLLLMLVQYHFPKFNFIMDFHTNGFLTLVLCQPMLLVFQMILVRLSLSLVVNLKMVFIQDMLKQIRIDVTVPMVVMK